MEKLSGGFRFAIGVPQFSSILVGFALFNMFKPSTPMGSPIYENPQVSHLSQLSDLSELPAAHIRHVLPLQWPRSTWARHHFCLADSSDSSFLQNTPG